MNVLKWYVSDDKPWFKHYQEGVPKHPEFPVISLGDWFNQKTEENAKSKAIWFSKTFMNYRVLRKYTDSLATSLARQGIKKGDVVAILLPNSFQFSIAYFATVKLGAIVTPLNPTYKPLELLHSLTMTKAKVLVLMDMLYIAGPATILPKSDVKYLIPSNFVDFLTADDGTIQQLGIPNAKEKIPSETEDYKIFWMKDILDTTESREISVDIDVWKDPAVYLMTGGTTGLPKVAMLSHANLLSNLHMIKPWVNLEPGMITIGSIPFFHSFGMTGVMNGALTLGMQMLLFPKPPSDDVLSETINKLDAPQGIIYVGVEMLFKRLTDYVHEVGVEEYKKKYSFTEKLKYASQGAGPLHDHIRVPFEEIFCPIRVGYGLTETSPVCSIAPYWGPNKTGKLGLPLPGVDWAIFDSNNFEAGPICDGTPERNNFGVEYTGEICVAGPHVMLGYLGEQKEQENNLKMWNGKRWLLTGDIGFMDEHGFCEIRDRKKSLIKVSGHSVYPKEVEDLMGHHPMIDEVAVAGLPDESTGEKVKAWITLKKGYKVGKNVEIDDIKKWCIENMAKWKSPRLIEVVRKLPVSMTGKVQRRELQEKDKAKMESGKEIKG